jgi:cytochrome P450
VSEEVKLIRSQIFGFVIGGHDTSSTTITWALKFLADDQSVQAKLRSSLQDSMPKAKSEMRNPTIEEILRTKNHYLDATIEEFLRCSGTVPMVDREALCDTELLGRRIPKGTVVLLLGQGASMRSPAFDIDPSLRRQTSEGTWAGEKERAWDPDGINEFDPERWLVASSSDGSGAKEFDGTAGPQLAFSLGPRGCYGKRLAYLELRILLSLIVWNFELLQCPQELSGYEGIAGITRKPVQCYVRLRMVNLGQK